MRLIPLSLNDYCATAGIKGKLSNYNKKWNDISILYNWNDLIELIKYLYQDINCLSEATDIYRNLYFKDYCVDMLTCVSAPSLSIKI